MADYTQAQIAAGQAAYDKYLSENPDDEAGALTAANNAAGPVKGSESKSSVDVEAYHLPEGTKENALTLGAVGIPAVNAAISKATDKDFFPPRETTTVSTTQPGNRPSYTSGASGTKDPAMEEYKRVSAEMERAKKLPDAQRGPEIERIRRSTTPDIRGMIDDSYADHMKYKVPPKPPYTPDVTHSVHKSPLSTAGKAGHFIGGRLIPGAMAGYDAATAYERARQGDYKGAILPGLSAVGGVMQMYPPTYPLGTALTYGAGGLDLLQDYIPGLHKGAQ